MSLVVGTGWYPSLSLYYNIKSVHYRYVIDSLCLYWMWLGQPSEWVRFWLRWSSPEAPLRPEFLVSKEGYQFCDSKVPWPNGQGSRFFQALELYLSAIVIFMLKVSKKVSCVIAVRWLCLITHLHFLHLKFPWKHLCVSHVYIYTHTYIYMYSYHISRCVLIHLHNICVMCSYRMHMLYRTVCYSFILSVNISSCLARLIVFWLMMYVTYKMYMTYMRHMRYMAYMSYIMYRMYMMYMTYTM